MNENKAAEQNCGPDTSSSFEIKEDGFAQYRELMTKKQNMTMGIIGGIAASIVGNAVWIGITLLGYKIDFLALCVGFFIGYSVKFLGKGIGPKFGYAAGTIAFVSTLIAYFLLGCILFGKVNHISFLSVFNHMNITTALYLLRGVIKFWDVIFCLGAVGIAYYFSFKPLKEF